MVGARCNHAEQHDLLPERRLWGIWRSFRRNGFLYRANVGHIGKRLW